MEKKLHKPYVKLFPHLKLSTCDKVKYVSFMHNFETCLEKDIHDNSRGLKAPDLALL